MNATQTSKTRLPKDASPSEAVVLALPFYTVTRDSAADPAEDWAFLLYDADGDYEAGFATEAEAVETATRYNAEAEAEERSERISTLHDAIAEAVYDVEDEGTLAAVLALLKK